MELPIYIGAALIFQSFGRSPINRTCVLCACVRPECVYVIIFLHLVFCWAFTCWQLVGCRFAYVWTHISFFCCCFFLAFFLSFIRWFSFFFSLDVCASGIFWLISHRLCLWSSSTQCIGFMLNARACVCTYMYMWHTACASILHTNCDIWFFGLVLKWILWVNCVQEMRLAVPYTHSINNNNTIGWCRCAYIRTEPQCACA